MAMLRILFFATFLCSVLSFSLGVKYSAFQTPNLQWEVREGEDGAAWGHLREEAEKTGWNVLEVVTNKSYPDNIQAFAAGYVEGALTHHLIWHSWRSFSESNGPFSDQLIDFVTANDRWVRLQAQHPPGENHDYWYQVNMVINQFDGLMEGHNRHAPVDRRLTAVDFLLYQLTWELGDIETALNISSPQRKRDSGLPGFDNLHCSSIVKPSPDGMSLFSSHVTWTGYRNMLRIYKHYTTNFNHNSNKAPTSSFSSFPGNLPSGDDWYITSSKLVVMETTNGVMNQSLFFKFVTEKTVMYWIRVIVANRMAVNGKEWSKIFALYNSGTYNNQWMVVDYKLFTPGAALKPGTLWVAEQIPGYVVMADQTNALINAGYWASYNVPFYPFIYDVSEYPIYYKKYGNAYSYSECARAQIFRRDQGQVYSLDDVKKLMRYNEWQTDPLALQDACRGISARCDLNPPWVTNSLNGYTAFGAIDAKVTDYEMAQRLETHAVSGPTWDSQPPFAWTEQWKDVPHYGQPRMFAFEFESMVPVGNQE